MIWTASRRFRGVLDRRAYQLLFVGYWIWGNFLDYDFLPSLSKTVLTPVGWYAATGFFGSQVHRDTLAYTPLEAALSVAALLALTARQFVDYMAILKRMADPTVRRRRVDAALETVGLAEVADCKLKAFSGGMKRRVGIAQALVNDPRILIVDEPTAGLDPEERIRFRNLLAELSGDRVVLLSTHIVEDIGQVCRDMAVLDRGEVRFRGSPADLIAAARGMVWQITSPDGRKPDNSLTVVSTLHLARGVQYRVVGRPGTDYPDAQAVQPSLEDGYICLMQGITGWGRRG